jgi:glycosyltransferase involved in cell wall biosynthesis
LVNPLDIGSISDGVLRVIEERDALSARARDRAAQLTWKRTAQLTREVYAEAVADGPRRERR